MKARAKSSRPIRLQGARRAAPGFTLVEIMVVVAILGILLTMSIPAMNRGFKHAPMIQTVKEIREVCSHARARAIFSGKTAQVVFRPQEGTFAIAGGSGSGEGPKPSSGGRKGAGKSGTIPDSVRLEEIAINQSLFGDQPLAVINFYPNGTCDEVFISLVSNKGEKRIILLEWSTGHSRVLTEAQAAALGYGK